MHASVSGDGRFDMLGLRFRSMAMCAVSRRPVILVISHSVVDCGVLYEVLRSCIFGRELMSD
jgi:hypothetical protein